MILFEKRVIECKALLLLLRLVKVWEVDNVDELPNVLENEYNDSNILHYTHNETNCVGYKFII